MRLTTGRHLAATSLLISLLLPLTASATEATDWQPWDERMDVQHHQHAPEASQLNPLVLGVRFFQRYISVVDSPRCPMYPTCSAYALQAMDKHGPWIGMFMTVDRILHETNPLEQTQPLTGYERLRYYDPVSNNDFWWSAPASERHDPE